MASAKGKSQQKKSKGAKRADKSPHRITYKARLSDNVTRKTRRHLKALKADANMTGEVALTREAIARKVERALTGIRRVRLHGRARS